MKCPLIVYHLFPIMLLLLIESLVHRAEAETAISHTNSNWTT